MIQFGVALIYFDSEAVGYVQDGSIDIAYEKALLWDGNDIFPKQIVAHSGAVSGSGSYAQLTAEGFYKILGGTLMDIGETHRLRIVSTTAPPEIELQFSTVLNDKTFRFTFPRVMSGQLGVEFARDGYIIPGFEFQAVAEETGSEVVAYIDFVGATDPIS